MKNAEQRAKKRFKREKRSTKEGSWACSRCMGRHPKGQRCPVHFEAPRGYW